MLLQLSYEFTKIPVVLYIELLLPYVLCLMVNKRAVLGWLYSSLTFLVFIFLALNCSISLLSGDCLTDTLGSAIRFLIFPFFIGIFYRSINDPFWGALVYTYPLFSVLGKGLVYLITNKLYGGPIYVVDFNPFSLASMVSIKPIIVWVTFFAVLLSLKRSSWLLLLVFLSGQVKNLKHVFFVFVALIIFMFTLKGTLLWSSLETRFMYTLAALNGDGNEGSISKRVLEYESVMNEHRSFVNYLFGLGGGAGYSGNFKNNNINCKGEYYHIHNMWILLFHRYGFIGTLIYVLLLLRLLFKFLSNTEIARLVFIVVLGLFTFTGNVFFGGFWLTLILLYESNKRTHIYLS